ncbi:MAG: hypothetical protein E5Y16_18295, partial [Mesorhizobium sp.]
MSAPGVFCVWRLVLAISEQASADLRLACIQFQPAIGRLEDNLKSMERLIRQAAGLGATVVVLPELADSGYVFDSQEELAAIAAPIPAGRSAVLL